MYTYIHTYKCTWTRCNEQEAGRLSLSKSPRITCARHPYIHTYMYIHIYTHTHIYIILTYIYIQMYMDMLQRAGGRAPDVSAKAPASRVLATHTYIHTYIYIYIRTYTHTCIRIYIHTNAHGHDATSRRHDA